MSRVHSKKTTAFNLPRYNDEIKPVGNSQPLLEPYAGIVEPVILDNVKILKADLPLASRIQGGSTDGNGSATGTVTFNPPFSSAPVVVANVEHPPQNTGYRFTVTITGTTATQFTFRKSAQPSAGGAWNDATSEFINWIAFKP